MTLLTYFSLLNGVISLGEADSSNYLLLDSIFSGDYFCDDLFLLNTVNID